MYVLCGYRNHLITVPKKVLEEAIKKKGLSEVIVSEVLA